MQNSKSLEKRQNDEKSVELKIESHDSIPDITITPPKFIALANSRRIDDERK